MAPGGRAGTVFRWLVRFLLPRAFAVRHGHELVEVFLQLRDDARRAGGGWRVVRVWLRELRSLIALGVRLRVRRRRHAFDAPAPYSGGRGRAATSGWLASEARFAWRRLTSRPGATLVVVATLALGIGANTAIFSVLDGVFLDPIDYAYPERTVSLAEVRQSDGVMSGVAYGNLVDLASASETMEALAPFVPNSIIVTGDGVSPERVRGMFVNADYFRVVGVEPVLGRAIAPGEDEPGDPRVTVLSYGYWLTRFGGDPDVLGRSITLNSEVHEIVGVMPGDFRPFWDNASLWVSLHTVPRDVSLAARSAKNFPLMGLVRDGVSFTVAADELAGLMEGLREAYPEGNADWRLRVQPMVEVARSGTRTLMFSLVTAVGLLLLVACANLANVQLARTADQSRERAVRLALGGSRSRIMGSALVENLMLGLGGGAAGVLVAVFGVRWLLRLDPRLATTFEVGVDSLALGFALVLSIATGLLFGVGPAIRAAGADPAGALSEAGRGNAGGRRGRRLRSSLVVGQVGVAAMLLCCTGLLVRSIGNLTSSDVGFDTDGVLMMEFRLTGDRYDQDEEVIAFFRELLPRMNAVPGVELAATAHAIPFTGDFGTQAIVEPGGPTEEQETPLIAIRNEVSPEYFETLRIPISRGRALRESDDRAAPLVVVVSEALADQIWPGEEVLGKQLRVLDDRIATVVGVAGSVKRQLDGNFQREIYFSVYQVPWSFVGVAVRTAEDPSTLAPSVREAIQSLEPDQAVWEAMPLADRIGGSIGDERLLSLLLALFSIAGLLLASVGVYGVLAHGVSQRTREIGVRVAVGARRREVVGMVLRQGVGLVTVGLVLGLGGALGLSTLLRSQLFGVDPLDPLTFSVVAVIVLLTAVVASYLPARRAARLDPVRSLTGS